ncbi:MAG: phosphatidate cytidylyltransferase [Fimbriimonadaceae bacterium]|nr:phosphatidate cytidylyltransferase [Fimbriimonadaceae bacterium]
MLPPRIITGTVYLFAWLLLAWLGGWPLTLAVCALSFVAVLELHWVASRRRLRLAKEIAYAVCTAFVMAAHYFANDLDNWGLAALALIVMLVLVDFAMHLQLGLRAPTAGVSLTVFGAVYCGLLLSAVVLVRGLSPELTASTAFGTMSLGQRLLYFLLVVTMVSDVGAYVVGRLAGQRKLSWTVSPQKTVEGCLGGLVFAIAAALLAGHLFNVGVLPTSELLPSQAGRISLWHRLVLGVLLGICGQIGDFGASIFKREAEIKDYGAWFPGHGGVLDRLDSLILNAPLLYLYVQLSM